MGPSWFKLGSGWEMLLHYYYSWDTWTLVCVAILVIMFYTSLGSWALVYLGYRRYAKERTKDEDALVCLPEKIKKSDSISLNYQVSPAACEWFVDMLTQKPHKNASHKNTPHKHHPALHPRRIQTMKTRWTAAAVRSGARSRRQSK